MFPSNFTPRGPSLVEEESTLPRQVGATETSDDQPLVAHLVEEPSPLPTTMGTVVNTKQRRIITVFGLILVAVVISIAVVYTLPGGVLLKVTSSPTSSLEPSASPSLFPSASPSTSLFGFLAANSFDHGTALATPGSPQLKAMDWLLTQPQLSIFNYTLLQNYVLATLYYATLGNQWTFSGDTYNGPFPLLSTDLGWCRWQGVSCNSNGDVSSLQLYSNRLVGSIPAEPALLDQSLSKVPEFK